MRVANKKLVSLLGLAISLFGVIACSSTSEIIHNNSAKAEQSSSAEKVIVLGDVSTNPQKKIRKFQPLANYLAANLSQFDRGKVKIAPDMATMITWLKSGEVDIYIDSPYPAMLAVNDAEAKPILRRWKKGHAEYHSIIFTMGDSNVKSLADLKGEIVAFDHPASTTGYMLPLATMSEAGLQPIEHKSVNASVPKDEVGYVFSNEDENSIEWLLSRKVAAAAIDNIAFEKLSPEIKDKVIILAETEKVARNIVLVGKNMTSEQTQAISALLLQMDKTTEGKAVLEKFSRTVKFDDFPTQESLDKIQVLYQQTQNP